MPALVDAFHISVIDNRKYLRLVGTRQPVCRSKRVEHETFLNRLNYGTNYVSYWMLAKLTLFVKQ